MRTILQILHGCHNLTWLRQRSWSPDSRELFAEDLRKLPDYAQLFLGFDEKFAQITEEVFALERKAMRLELEFWCRVLRGRKLALAGGMYAHRRIKELAGKLSLMRKADLAFAVREIARLKAAEELRYLRRDGWHSWHERDLRKFLKTARISLEDIGSSEEELRLMKRENVISRIKRALRCERQGHEQCRHYFPDEIRLLMQEHKIDVSDLEVTAEFFEERLIELAKVTPRFERGIYGRQLEHVFAQGQGTATERERNRVLSLLKRSGIESCGTLVQKTEEELLQMSGIGRKALNLTKEILASFNLHLGMVGED